MPTYTLEIPNFDGPNPLRSIIESLTLPSGRPGSNEHREVTIYRKADKHSQFFLRRLASGTPIPEVVIRAEYGSDKYGKITQTTITLKGVYVSNFQAGLKGRDLEQITFNVESIEIKGTPTTNYDEYE